LKENKNYIIYCIYYYFYEKTLFMSCEEKKLSIYYFDQLKENEK